MALEIRTVPVADLQSWAESVSFANSEELSDEAWRDIAPEVEPERTFGAYEGDQVVGGGSIFSFDVTVPGGAALPCAGVTWIGIMPTHRRQGALRALMTRMIEDARARREPIAALWASEGSIYQRFGYGLATLASTIDLERDRAQLLSTEAPNGRVRLIAVDEAKIVFPPIFEHNRRETPGFFSRSPVWWDIDLADFRWARRGYERKFYSVHENDGRADAYAIYHVRQDWTNSMPGSELQVIEILALDGDALREMWRFIFGVDLVKRITTRRGPLNEPLMLMVAEPRRLNLRVSDALWLRIVDVPEALRQRTYEADDTLVLEVHDEFLPDAGGRFLLTVSDGHGAVEKTSEAPDIALDVGDLGAVYLGGFSFADLARAGRTTETTAGARARADAMFHTITPPWCPQTF